MVALALGISACGGDEQPSPSATAAASVAPEPTATPASSGGSEFTAPGTELGPGDAARVELVDSLEGGSWPIRITVLAIERGKPLDLRDFDIPAEKREHVPFYLRVGVRNLSDRPLNRNVEPATRLNAVDEAGNEAEPLLLIGEFKQCDSDTPNRIRGRASYRVCRTYLLPADSALARVQWEVASGGDPIVWTP